MLDGTLAAPFYLTLPVHISLSLKIPRRHRRFAHCQFHQFFLLLHGQLPCPPIYRTSPFILVPTNASGYQKHDPWRKALLGRHASIPKETQFVFSDPMKKTTNRRERERKGRGRTAAYKAPEGRPEKPNSTLGA